MAFFNNAKYRESDMSADRATKLMSRLLPLAVAAAFALSGCQDDPTVTKLQYMPDMADAPTAKTQLNYIDPPPLSVPTHAMFYPKNIEDSELTLTNPLVGHADEARLRGEGEELFQIYCSVCHGPTGLGDGRLGTNYPTAPSLQSDLYKGKKDGFFFHRITHGSAIMPGYGHATTIEERWKITLAVRHYQKQGK